MNVIKWNLSKHYVYFSTLQVILHYIKVDCVNYCICSEHHRIDVHKYLWNTEKKVINNAKKKIYINTKWSGDLNIGP